MGARGRELAFAFPFVLFAQAGISPLTTLYMCPATLRASLLQSQVTDTPVIRFREPLKKLEMDLWRFAQYHTVSDTLHVISVFS